MVVDDLARRWPKDDLEYVRLLASTVLVLVLVPLAIAHLVLDPIEASDHALRGVLPHD